MPVHLRTPLPCFCPPPGTSSQLGAGGGRATPPLVSLYPALECRAIMQQMSPTAFGERGISGGGGVEDIWGGNFWGVEGGKHLSLGGESWVWGCRVTVLEGGC